MKIIPNLMMGEIKNNKNTTQNLPLFNSLFQEKNDDELAKKSQQIIRGEIHVLPQQVIYRFLFFEHMQVVKILLLIIKNVSNKIVQDSPSS